MTWRCIRRKCEAQEAAARARRHRVELRQRYQICTPHTHSPLPTKNTELEPEAIQMKLATRPYKLHGERMSVIFGQIKERVE